jgi:hypothetical protein
MSQKFSPRDHGIPLVANVSVHPGESPKFVLGQSFNGPISTSGESVALMKRKDAKQRRLSEVRFRHGVRRLDAALDRPARRPMIEGHKQPTAHRQQRSPQLLEPSLLRRLYFNSKCSMKPIRHSHTRWFWVTLAGQPYCAFIRIDSKTLPRNTPKARNPE